ncbi:hypothetical protein [Flectobacillus longus]|uniref:hypothetical protein n=1 Tax=Flectobacillus longus TaxID=2984207 RepID=UPI0024B7B113|nr:hypothetical protein [Flectobacillus longus]MDI9882416.1 hypothetical protein [Flectobacillus longus]
MYTDQTLLTFGKYKFTQLCRVPPEYLLRIHQAKSYFNAELKEYIINNLERIIQRRDGIILTPIVYFPCKKVIYISKKEANRFLESIKYIGQNHKKPVRAYECDKCGYWHITSRENFDSKLKDQGKASARF